MNENKPNWADKANVALNAVQVVQNERLQESVSVLGALQAARAKLEIDDRQIDLREHQLREALGLIKPCVALRIKLFTQKEIDRFLRDSQAR